ncbi:MAG TPA: hypothetical protein VFH15_13620 [Pyrinomonadaceae bacterium]|nr:hypothetical protein [Pyrinomonadaceae bacterium]
MKNELGFLNLICIVVGLLFIAAAVLVALFYPPILSTDNLFIIMVCMVMALMFMSNPLLYLHSEGRLAIPFAKRLGRQKAVSQMAASSPPLLDAKGRAVPPDVKAMMAGMNRPRENQPR